MLADLWHAPDSINTVGASAVGSGTASSIAVQRILVRLGVSRDVASLLLDDFRNAIAHFDRHPVTVPLTHKEPARFNHM